MAQNLISLNLTAEDYAEIDAALTVLETKLAGLIPRTGQPANTHRPPTGGPVH